MHEENALLQVQFHIPFDRIRAEHVEPAMKKLLVDAQAEIDRLAAAPGPLTFDDTLGTLDVCTERLDYAMSVVRHLEGVATYPELRAAYNAVELPVSAFYTSIPLNEPLWKKVQAYAGTDEAKRLYGVRKRFLTKTVDSFRRHGADLDAGGKKRLREIDVELTEITTRFSQNVLDSTNQFELIVKDESKLAGLPPTAVEAARESASQKEVEGWRFTLQAPSFIAVMTYLDDRAIREQVYRAYNTRATRDELDNRPIISRILELRREKANLLGFKDFADLVLEDRMAHTGERAQEFLDRLKLKTEARFRKENDELRAFSLDLKQPSAGADLEAWDVAYYSEKQRAALYDFDEEALRPYFELKRVVAGMFEIYGRVFGIQVKEETGIAAWDAEVKYYTISDESEGNVLGAFYTDWHPRENKRGGAWMDALITGARAGEVPHLGLICGNLTPPVGGKPALLTHREVETIFHEFGHLLHHCLSRVELRSLSGTNVAWDFVELPSQILENWCWEREGLDLFACHWETGEPIPEELFAKMKRARNFRVANFQMRQLGFGIVDLALHREYLASKDSDVADYSRRILQEFLPGRLPKDYGMIASFTHIFSSPVAYGAGYYSYKWAEVLDADAFQRFKASGIFNREVGLAFRENILSKGDSEDPAILYRGFMGRDPDPDALLERQGLGTEAG